MTFRFCQTFVKRVVDSGPLCSSMNSSYGEGADSDENGEMSGKVRFKKIVARDGIGTTSTLRASASLTMCVPGNEGAGTLKQCISYSSNFLRFEQASILPSDSKSYVLPGCD